MSEREFGVVLIGGARRRVRRDQARRDGRGVAAVEENLVGGECPFWACNPSEMMIRAGSVLADAHLPRRRPEAIGRLS